jgi:phage baseplate assembly protein gpV
MALTIWALAMAAKALVSWMLEKKIGEQVLSSNEHADGCAAAIVVVGSLYKVDMNHPAACRGSTPMHYAVAFFPKPD